MLFIIAISGMVLLAAIFWLLGRFRLNFRFEWQLGIGGGLIAWVLVLVAGLQLPVSIPFFPWRPETIFLSSPALQIDQVSWPLAIGITTLLLMILLTSPLRMPDVNRGAWAGNFSLAAMGLLAVCSANPLSLVISWAAIDILELIILLQLIGPDSARHQLVNRMAFRALGMGFFIAVLVLNPSGNTFADFKDISPVQNLFLILAASLRLGVLPISGSFLQEEPLRRGLGSSLRLVPAAAGIIALARTTGGELPGAWVTVLLILAIITCLYAAVVWLSAKDDLDGRVEWVLGLSALAITAHILNQPDAVVGFGLMMILTGSLVFLNTIRNRRTMLIQIAMVLLSVGLPYTITWAIAGLFSHPYPSVGIMILPLQAAFLVGTIIQARKPVEIGVPYENWRALLGYLGHLTGLLVYLLLGVWVFRSRLQYAIWPGFIVLGLVILLGFVLNRWQPALPDRFLPIFRRIFSFGWIYSLFSILSLQIANGVSFLNRILEGEGGILWALLLLAMLLALLGQALS
jgi:hypothetical protein